MILAATAARPHVFATGYAPGSGNSVTPLDSFSSIRSAAELATGGNTLRLETEFHDGGCYETGQAATPSLFRESSTIVSPSIPGSPEMAASILRAPLRPSGPPMR